MVDAIDFQPYLESLFRHYNEWEKLYTLTDVEGKKTANSDHRRVAPFDFGLMMRSVKLKEPESRQERSEKSERRPVLEGLRKSLVEAKHILLIGRPGSGKSTALARLLLEEAQQGRENADKIKKIPVLVELRYYQTSVLDLMQEFFRRHDLQLETHQVETLLSSNRLLLLVDGLNELSSDEAARQDIVKLRNYRNVPMIFTTRDLSLGGDFGIEKQWEMLPLTEPQMQEFIQSHLSLEQADSMWRQLKDRTRNFAETPLLLWMLCELFAAGEEIPRNLGEVFRIFTRAYEHSSIRKYEVAALKGDVQPLCDRRLWFPALKHLAYVMMQGQTPVDSRTVIERGEVEREFKALFKDEPHPAKTARDCLDDLLKYHLLQIKTNDEIEFRHQLIQEYYAAEWLLQRLDNLTDEQLKYYFLNYLKWTEAIGLMLALVNSSEQALKLIRLTIEVDLILKATLAGALKNEYQQQAISLITQRQISQILKIILLGKTRSEYVLPLLSNMLYDRNSKICEITAEVLGEITCVSSVRILEEALNHKIPAVCEASAEALGKISSKDAVAVLIQALKHKSPNVRWSAAEALGQIDGKLVVKALIEALEDPDSDVRWSVAEALGETRSELAVEALIRALNNDEDLGVLWGSAEALGEIGSESALSGLATALNHENDEVQWAAIEGLKLAQNNAALGILIDALNHTDSETCAGIAEALGDIGNELAVPSLIKAIEHKDSYVRYHALGALERTGSEAAVEALIQALSYKRADVRSRAAWLLGLLKIESAVPSLSQALHDKDSDVRWSAAEALRMLGSEDAKDALIEALDSEDSDIPWSAARALGAIDPKAAVSTFTPLLNHIDPYIRGCAIYLLGEVGDKFAIPILTQALKDEDFHVRSNVVEALEKTNSEISTLALIKALKDKDSHVRWCAIGALKLRASEKAVNALIQALGHQDDSTSWAAAEALEEVGSIVIEPLFKALKHKDSTIRWYSGNLLSKIGQPELLPALQKSLQKAADSSIVIATTGIQARCKYYNYDIAQSSPPPSINLDAPSVDRSPTYNFYAPVGNVAGDVYGDQITNQQPKLNEQE